jgi:phosphoglycolate phosphatase
MIKIIFFDADGTIFDSLKDITTAVNHSLNLMGIPELSMDIIKKFTGDGSKELIRKSLFLYYNDDDKVKECIDEVMKHYMEYYKDHSIDYTKTFPNVISTLERLGTINIVLTNKPLVLTERLISGFNMSKYFKKVISPETYSVRKPDPKPINETLKEYLLDKSEAMIVGDSPYDMLCGKNADIKRCFASFGYSRIEDIPTYDFVINDFSEILGIV